VTSQKDQIQALIHEIDGVLNKPIPRIPWVNYEQSEQQRQVLEQTRAYLTSLEQQMGEAERSGNLASASGVSPYPVPPQFKPYPTLQASAAAESAQQILQAVLQEMSYLRSNVMQPLRHDVETLQQQREVLAQEIRLLESQRQQYGLPSQPANQQQVITEFLQSLMGRLQENLTGQVAQMLSNLEVEAVRDRALPSASPEIATGGDAVAYQQPILSPTQRLEHLQAIQAQSDQLLLTLDSTLRVIFESLQNNIQSYQESLSQGLDKMHSLGQQGEAMFSALINRLAQELGREASNYLQSTIQPGDWEVGHPLSKIPSQPQAAVSPQLSLGTTTPGTLPSTSPPISETLDTQLDLLLNQLGGNDEDVSLQLPTTQFMPDSPIPSERINLLDIELNNVNLETDPARYGSFQDENLTFFQLDQPLTSPQDHDEDLPFFQLDEDITQIQSDEMADEGVAATEHQEEVENLDSALDLLNQLTADLQAESEPVATEPEAREITVPPSPDTDRGMNELYQSLFGIGGTVGASHRDEEPVDQHAAEASPVNPLMAASDSLPLELELEPAENVFAPLGDDLFEEQQSDSAQDEHDTLPPELPLEVSDQSLESLLFGEDLSVAKIEDQLSLEPPDEEEWLPGWQEEQEMTAPVAGSEEIDAIASLTDLIDTPGTTSTAGLTDLLQSEPDVTSADEDKYIPASPDEDLLVTEEAETLPKEDLYLSADALQQLTHDLSSLENLDESDLPPPESQTGNWEDSEWTLVSDLEEPQQPQAEVETVLPSETEATFDQDFDLEEADLFPEGFHDPSNEVDSEMTWPLTLETTQPLQPEVPSSVAETVPAAPAEPTLEDLFHGIDEIGVTSPAAAANETLDETTVESLFAVTEPDALFADEAAASIELISKEPASEPINSVDLTFEDAASESTRLTLEDFERAIPAPPVADTPTELTLEDFERTFATVPALDTTDTTTADLFTGIEAMPQTESREKTEDESNAFTLEGLDSLFEDVPDLDDFADTPLPESLPDSQEPELTLESIFEGIGKESDLGETLFPPEVNPPDPDSPQKKSL
jgi:hypothetical protein